MNRTEIAHKNLNFFNEQTYQSIRQRYFTETNNNYLTKCKRSFPLFALCI